MTSTTHMVSAIDVLMDDHRNVTKLFKQFEKTHRKASADENSELVEQICTELTLHASVEEEIFYPAARKAIADDELMNEAEVEHAGAKDLIAQIRELDPTDPMYAAKVTVLGENVQHHVEEEENEIFPKVRKAKLDLEALGEQIMQAKESSRTELLAVTKSNPKSGGSAAHR